MSVLNRLKSRLGLACLGLVCPNSGLDVFVEPVLTRELTGTSNWTGLGLAYHFLKYTFPDLGLELEDM